MLYGLCFAVRTAVLHLIDCNQHTSVILLLHKDFYQDVIIMVNGVKCCLCSLSNQKSYRVYTHCVEVSEKCG